MRAYNPALKGMVDNYRSMAKTLDLDTSGYSDEQLYRLIDFWSGMSTGEDTENAVMEDIQDGTKR